MLHRRDQMPAWITTGEAAILLNQTIRTAIRKADDGVFGPVQYTKGGQRRLDRDAVLAHAMQLRRVKINKLPPLDKIA